MDERPITNIRVGPRYRRDPGDIGALARSIEEVGLLHPIVITPDNQLIAGGRRIEAFKLLGRTLIPVHVVDVDQIVTGEFHENFVRKDFLPTEMVAIRQAVEPIEREAARIRQLSGLKRGTEAPVQESFLNGTGQARDKVAEYVGVSGKTLEKAHAVVQAAEAEPEKYARLVEQMDKSGKIDGVYKQLKRARQAEAIEQEPPVLPTGPFRVVVIDPPWSYEKRASDPSHRAALPYPDMTIDEIKAMRIADIAHEDAILWLWTTNAHLRCAYEILDAWGFEPKTILTWVKDRMGTGDWLRGQTEHCLLAVRGKPVVRLTNETTVLHAPLRDHSRKPEEFFRLVETLCPGSKVEVFSRSQRPGWTVFGDEVQG